MVTPKRRRPVERMPAAQTRTESLRLKIEEEILEGRARPGQKLDEEELAGRFGMSRTPVREALKAVAATGLVEIRPHQGAYVAVLSPRVIIDMVEMMKVLEITCARFAARRHSRDDRKAIEKGLNQCIAAATAADSRGFYRANVVFHEAIYTASGNDFLASQSQLLRQRLEPYRRQIVYHEGLVDRSVKEHADICHAIFAMDETAAERAMQTHLEALQDSISTMVEAITSTGKKSLAG
ncbi:GntR family transcriptional regulator [Bradyrhizobium sp. BR 10289]|uniref:GntR family transcriptional regulator n=1 Tax=Bradyrhizobium sp. BR 10289 TaxID=2749993 RepID=UPI001C6524F1|nr:GntR family transcriptional regulator [Bradyrhizobium sp. BR 10289]MBW7970254.1 GntR family transcriptional regulator [Bradyrhizobium sp. BR 10289]